MVIYWFLGVLAISAAIGWSIADNIYNNNDPDCEDDDLTTRWG